MKSPLQVSFPLPRWWRSQDYKPITDSEQSVEDEKYADGKYFYEPRINLTVAEPAPSRTRVVLSALSYAFTPELLAKGEPRRLNSTSWLDGLRGVAAFFVAWHHGTVGFYKPIRNGWHATPTSNNLLSLPILRIFLSGSAMVDIFFVISGYVLSVKAFKLARHGGKHAEIYSSIGSSTFRRGPRLYIPTLSVILLTAIAAQIGITDPLAPLPYRYPASANMFDQLHTWFNASLWYITPWSGYHIFEQNSWTIPYEFKGSLFVFLTCMGLARSGDRFRGIFLWGMLCFWLYFGSWDFYLFNAGMCAADFGCWWNREPERVVLPVAVETAREEYIVQDEDAVKEEQDIADQQSSAATKFTDLPLEPMSPSRPQIQPISIPPPQPQSPRRRNPFLSILYALLLVLILYLLTPPENGEGYATSPGYIWLYNFTPSWWVGGGGAGRWWPCLASLFLVLLVEVAGPDSVYQRVLTTRFAQYLGDVSFSLYLCHGPVLHTVVSRVIRWVCESGVVGLVDWNRAWLTATEPTGGWGYVFALFCGALAGWPVAFYVSEISTRVFDKGGVKLARKMFSW